MKLSVHGSAIGVVCALLTIASCAPDRGKGDIGAKDDAPTPSAVNTRRNPCSSAQGMSFAGFFDEEWTNPCVDETGSGVFGQWIADADGLPVYEYQADPMAADFPDSFVTGGHSRDHWHFFGNDRWGATAHNDGRVEIYDLSRGLKNLNRFEPETGNFTGGYKFLRAGERTLSTRWDLLPTDATQSRIFGMGYAEKTTEWNGVRLRERVSAPSGDDPVLTSTTDVTNLGDMPVALELVEFWDPNPTQMTFAPVMTYGLADLFWDYRRRINDRFAMTFVDEPGRGVIGAGARTLNATPPSYDEPAEIDEYPGTMFLAALDSTTDTLHRALDRDAFVQWPDASAWTGVPPEGRTLLGGTAVLAFSREVILAPGKTRRVRYLVGYAKEDDIANLVEDHRDDDEANPPLTDFVVDDAPWLWREIAWHAASLFAGSYFSEYFDTHFVDQGSAYSYLQGLSGAHRDFALFTLPMVWMRPDLAKDMLRFSLRAQSAENGALPYAHVGHGLVTGAFIHEESSDLDLFLMWAAAEYLNATREFEFLNERLPYYPKSSGVDGTVLEHLVVAFRHLRDEIGVGPHGLIRAGTGDWNDVLIAFSPWPAETKKDGESALNGALATVALPLLADAVAETDPAFAAELRAFAEEQKEALRPLWRDGWMARGYLGHDDATLGDDRLFLDAQPFGVLGGVWSAGQQDALFSAINRHLVDTQSTGARSMWPTMTGPLLDPGSDTNGGTWSAIDGLLTWAWATRDVEAAWRFFLSTTLAAHAEAYPENWYGIWSGPDSFNADDHSHPGETFNSTVTPMTDFPVMNMNRHAGVLLSAIRLAGIEANSGRIVIDPKLPGKNFTWRSGLIGVSYSENVVRGYYRPVVDGTFVFSVRSPVRVGSGPGMLKVSGEPHVFATEGENVVFSVRARPGEKVEWEYTR